MLIRHIVTPATDVAFVSDVKLDALFDPELNRRLACGYQFSFQVPDLEKRNLVASIELVERLYRSLLDGTENRHVVMATYGHGKSHLALTLANFFGKSLNSPEVTGILERVAHASTDSIALNLREFKQGCPPLLAVCLNGTGGSMAAQFMQGLEKALAAHENTRGETLPFWFTEAERFLSGLDPHQRQRADAFLQSYNTDTAVLLTCVRAKQPQYYDLCADVFRHLYGHRPDFGGETSLETAVQWAIETFCTGPERKAGGLLVLFDEFSAFIHDYALRREAGGSSTLQNLLDGISKNPGNALFVAFSQHDPDTTAKNAMRNISSREQEESLAKELTRLPSTHRYNLYSSLETVLDSYLSQDEAEWEALDSQTNYALQDAANYARTLLGQRYEASKGWTEERFDSIIVKGCFPFHPLTIGLFCHLEFSNARPVLQFIHSELETRMDQPAYTNNRPNWVYPIALIDYFGSGLATDREYEDYEIARRQAGPEIPEIQKAVFKAILLFSVGQLTLKRLRFEQAVAELTGYSTEECQQTLEELGEGGYIQFNAANKTWQFSVGGRGNNLEKQLRAAIQGKALDEATLRDINSSKASFWLPPIEVGSITWGHRDDWACPEILLTRACFDVETLCRYFPLYRLNNLSELQDGKRNGLVRLIAETEAEVAWFEENAPRILDEAFPGPWPLPVVVAVPHQPHPDLIRRILTFRLLNDDAWVRNAEIGSEARAMRRERADKEVKEQLAALRAWANYVVPTPYRAKVEQEATRDKVESLLSVCCQAAYPGSANARHFFSHCNVLNSKLRSGVKSVAPLLARDQLAEQETLLEPNPVAKEVVRNFVRPGAWGLVDLSNRLRQPENSLAQWAWKVLDATVPQGSDSALLRDAILTLLNPPYGFDFNVITLLLCAWYGYNRHDLELRDGTTIGKLDDYFKYLERPRGFLTHLCGQPPILLTRRDPGKEEQAINELLAQLPTPAFALNREQAREKITSLTEYATNPQSAPDLQRKAQQWAERLQKDLDTAIVYQQQMQPIQTSLNVQPSRLKELLESRKSIDNLPNLGKVQEDWATKAQLTASLDHRIQDTLTQECQNLAQLRDMTRYMFQKEALQQRLKIAESRGYAEVETQAREALETLEQRKQTIETNQHDAQILGEVRGIREQDQLHALRHNLERLDKLAGKAKSEETKQQIVSKRERIEERIEAEQRAVADYQAKADKPVTVKQVSQLKDELLRETNAYRDTPEYATMEAISHRCNTLGQCFLLVEQAVQAPLQSPQDAQDRLKRLENLGQENASFLSEAQQEVVQQAQGTLRRLETVAIGKACDWLDKCEGEVEKTRELEALRRRIEQPPPFLPLDCQSRITALQQRIQYRMDNEAALVIVEKFKGIKDREQRRECLRQLQVLLESEA